MTIHGLHLGIMMAAVGSLTGTSADAASLVRNGNFVGAVYETGDLAGMPVPTPFIFGSHLYLRDFGWTDTGSDLVYVAQSGSQPNAPGGAPLLAHAPVSPVGYVGNVYVADASPDFSKSTYLSQTLTDLTVGQRYVISFLQAAGGYYTGADITQPWNNTAGWDVGFGGTLSFANAAWTLSSDADHARSATMNIDAVSGTSPWQRQSVAFTARNTSELLSFFATGSGAPPFALLAGVSASEAAVPEPSAWALMLLGFGVMGAMLRRRRRAHDALAYKKVAALV